MYIILSISKPTQKDGSEYPHFTETELEGQLGSKELLFKATQKVSGWLEFE